MQAKKLYKIVGKNWPADTKIKSVIGLRLKAEEFSDEELIAKMSERSIKIKKGHDGRYLDLMLNNS